MPYIHITRAPGSSLADYRTIREAAGEGPVDGQLIHVACEDGGTLHVFDVFDSKASADRFAAERLFPAFQRTGLSPSPETSYTEFETDDLVLDTPGR